MNNGNRLTAKRRFERRYVFTRDGFSDIITGALDEDTNWAAHRPLSGQEVYTPILVYQIITFSLNHERWLLVNQGVHLEDTEYLKLLCGWHSLGVSMKVSCSIAAWSLLSMFADSFTDSEQLQKGTDTIQNMIILSPDCYYSFASMSIWKRSTLAIFVPETYGLNFAAYQKTFISEQRLGITHG
ncbi:hypothetical protein WG66_014669 [Moniliophthora roreri]|nr:hypothetical protein WG66_014669 [Moniliophthora roreri]